MKVPRDGFDEYIQVKVYSDPDGVIEKIKEVNEKVLEGGIENVDQVNFAVNSDIYESVKEAAEKSGLKNKIYDLGASRDDLRDALISGVNTINETSLLYKLFFGGFFPPHSPRRLFTPPPTPFWSGNAARKSPRLWRMRFTVPP